MKFTHRAFRSAHARRCFAVGRRYWRIPEPPASPGRRCQRAPAGAARQQPHLARQRALAAPGGDRAHPRRQLGEDAAGAQRRCDRQAPVMGDEQLDAPRGDAPPARAARQL
ncbi:hypothetical protein L1887_58104 [Cichorium endivia]|nr:hypothetical protein L1887_58104 [Cichorium endivia]